MSLPVRCMPLGYHGEGARDFLPILVAELSNLDERIVFLSSRRGRRCLLCGSLWYSNGKSRCMFRYLEWKWGNCGSSATHRLRCGGGKSVWSDWSQLKHLTLCCSAARTADRRRKCANAKTVHAPTPQIVQKVNFKRQQAPSGRFLYAGEMNAFQEAWSPACALVHPYGLIKEDDIVGSARRVVDDCWNGGHEMRVLSNSSWCGVRPVAGWMNNDHEIHSSSESSIRNFLWCCILSSMWIQSPFQICKQFAKYLINAHFKIKSFICCLCLDFLLGRKISWLRLGPDLLEARTTCTRIYIYIYIARSRRQDRHICMHAHARAQQIMIIYASLDLDLDSIIYIITHRYRYIYLLMININCKFNL